MTNPTSQSSMNGSTESSWVHTSFVPVQNSINSPLGMGSSEGSIKQAEPPAMSRFAPAVDPQTSSEETNQDSESKITYLPKPEEFFQKEETTQPAVANTTGSPMPKAEVVFKFDAPIVREQPVSPKPFFTTVPSFFEGFKMKIAIGTVAAATVAVLGYLFAKGRK